MAVPAGVTVMWPGTNGSIPTGWDRVTDMDDRFPKGTAAGVNPNVTGGSATHSHTGSTHTHSTSHGHGEVTSGAGSGSSGNANGDGGGVAAAHTHTGTPSDVSSTSGAGATTWPTSSNDPLYYRPIFIESDGSQQGYPDTCVVFFPTSSVPDDWQEHAASRSRYLYGMSSGGNGGGTGGSSGSHTHTASSSHTHSVAAHTHASSGVTAETGASVNNYDDKGGSTNSGGHSHSSLSLSSGGSETSGAATPESAATTHLPAFHILLGIQATADAVDTINVICMWLGALSAIPDAYNLCDGSNSTPDLRGKFIQMDAAGGGSINGTGGSAGHTHSVGSHTHTRAGHTHTAALAAGGSSRGGRSGSVGSPASHTHAGTSPTGASGTISGAPNLSTNSDTQPLFRTVAYIQQSEEIASVTFTPKMTMF